ncbi:flavin monoamine oxidase family protein [Pseudomonas chlororaphis]|uniref:Tryptophan 2-monooxygenase n=1 Tax=Pseudomonas chlororaphis TaxID=587753 RepID=A0A0D5XY25_9PSED|nr:FAD-dependent oxidoreductase [Pseudomonas chlororaphis]AKA23998.1 monoamine oxidase [Pseudomonas chlororaphis]
MAFTRRQLISRIAAVGGYSAAVGALDALGLAPRAVAAGFAPLQLGSSGNGKHVVVVGAGISGLVSAYELRKAGFTVTILEARERVGGRNWTLRRGSKVEFDDGISQTVDFDEGQFFNAGPARIPSHHQTLLGYCRELGVELQVLVNSSRNALALPDARQPAFQLRQAVNDTRGQLSELLARSVSRKALDQDLSSDDRQALLNFLKVYGDLNADLQYKGSVRSGYNRIPGAGDQTGITRDPLSLQTLLNPKLWGALVFDEIPEFSTTMFQPVGGMDRIPLAFYAKLKDAVRFHAEVSDIQTSEHGSRITYKDRQSGKTQTLDADYAIVTVPLPLLARLPNNFSAPFKEAIRTAQSDQANKVAWQSPRFWETDFNIYGGLSYLDHEVKGLWYPSDRLNSEQGILIAAYNIAETAQAFCQKPLVEQFASSRQAVELLHPGHSAKLHKPVAINWSKVPFSKGPWIVNDEVGEHAYQILNQPQGRTYLASDALAHGGVGIWQNSAADSARRIVSLIGRHAERQQAGVAA